MAISYAENIVDAGPDTTATTTSGSLTVLATSVITVVIEWEDNIQVGSLTIANSGTALSWTSIGVTNTNDNCKIAGWWAFGDGNGNRTVTVTRTDVGSYNRRLSCIVHEGASQTTPVPAGKVLSGVGTTDVSLNMTPTNASGSALWCYVADWNQTNSFAALTNCTVVWTRDVSGRFTGALVRPTTQPRTDGSAFTLGETDTAGKVTYLAFEVVAPAGAGDITYHGSAATPAGLNAAATGVADPTAVTPPASMLAGDLVCMIGHQRATGATLAVSATGGQTWNTLTAIGTTTVTARVFWCVYNGTWGANPSVDFDAVLCNSVQMHVFRPPAPGSTWVVNQAQVELDLAAGTGVHTVTGQTTTGTNPTVTLAGWFTADDNQWSTTSGTGWVTTGDEWYLNTSGTDHSSTYTHKIQSAAGATGNVSRTQSALGPDASTTFIVTFEAISPRRRPATSFSYAVNRAALH